MKPPDTRLCILLVFSVIVSSGPFTFAETSSTVRTPANINSAEFTAGQGTPATEPPVSPTEHLNIPTEPSSLPTETLTTQTESSTTLTESTTIEPTLASTEPPATDPPAESPTTEAPTTQPDPTTTSTEPTTTQAALDPPDDITYVAHHTNNITVSWTGGSGHDGFLISWTNVTDGGGSDDTIEDPDDTDYTITGLTPGVFYNISVATYRGTGSDEVSSPAESLIAGTDPLAPDNFKAVHTTYDAIQLTWSKPDGSYFTGVEINCTSESEDCSVDIPDYTQTAVIVRGLKGNVLYKFDFVFTSEYDLTTNSPRSETREASNWTLSAPVFQLTATSIDPKTLEVSWEYPVDNGDPPVDVGSYTCYQLRVYDESSGSQECKEAVFFADDLEACTALGGPCGDPVQKTFTKDVTYTVSQELEPCGNYSVEVVVVNEVGRSDDEKDTATMQTGAPEGPVQDVVFVSIDSESMILNWTRPENPKLCPIVAYGVRYKLTPDGDFKPENSSITVNEAKVQIDRLEPCGNYDVEISAFTSMGSDPSVHLVNGNTTAAAPASEIQNVLFWNISSDRLDVTWERPVEPEMCQITGYLVRYWLGEEEEEEEIAITGDKPWTEITNLEACGNYTVEISAFTSENEDAGESTVREVQDTAVAAPASEIQNISFWNISSDRMDVTWERPIEPEMCQITGYLVRYWLGEEEEEKDAEEIEISGDKPWTEITSLEACGNYKVEISAFTSEEKDAGASTVTEVKDTAVAAPASEIQSVLFWNISSDRMDVTWERPVEPEMCQITGYLVRYWLGEEEEEIVITGDKPWTEITNLEACGNYTVEISAFTSENEDAGESTVREVQDTAVAAPASEIQNVLFWNISSDRMDVTWERPIEPEMCQITGYLVRVWLEEEEVEEIEISGDKPWTEITSLEACGKYTVEISAFTSEDKDAGASTVTEVKDTAVAAPASEIQNVLFWNISSDRMDVTWERPIEPEMCQITGYLVRYWLGEEEEEKDAEEIEISGDKPWTEITSLEACGKYTVEISAFTSEDKDAGASTVTEVKDTAVADPEGPVLNVTFENIETDEMTVKWSGPEEPRLCPVIKYEVGYTLVNGEGVDSETIWNGTEWIMYNLESCGMYSVNISAFTRENGTAGNSTVMDEQITDTADPGPVQGLIVTSKNNTSVTVTWTAPIEPELCEILGYRISYTYKNCNTDSDEEISLNDTSSTTITISDLQPYWNYSIIVSGFTQEKTLGELKTVDVQTDEAAPGLPTDFKTTTNDPHWLNATWDLPEPCDRNGEITEYNFTYSCTEQDRPDTVVESGNIHVPVHEMFINVELRPYLECDLFVSAITSVATGPEANATGKTEMSTPGPIDPGSISSISLDDGFHLQWDEPEQRNGPIKNYTIEYKFSGQFAKENVETVFKTDEYNGTVYTPDQNITIDGLKPHVEYCFTITAFNDAGWGEPTGGDANICAFTDIQPATEVKNVVAYPDTYSVFVNWTKAEHKTGPTKYNVTVHDSESVEYDKHITVYGFDNNSVTVEGLDPNWWYNDVQVLAFTDAGHSNVTIGGGFLTKSVAPIAPPSFSSSVFEDEGKRVCTRLEINWSCHTGRDKKANITEYIVTVISESSQESLIFPVNDTEKEDYSDIISVSAETNYTFRIKAVAGNLEGGTLSWNEGIYSQSCPPVIPEGEDGEDDSSLIGNAGDSEGISSKHQFKVRVDGEFLINSQNGQITQKGIIVAQDDGSLQKPGEIFESVEEFEAAYSKTWFDVKNENPVSPYKAVDLNDDNQAMQRKRRATDDEIVTIGAAGDCEGPTNSICNGYVHSGRDYRVKVYTCTQGGCTVSAYSAIITTDRDITVAIIVGVLVPVVLIACLAGFIVFMIRRRNAPAKARRPNRNTSPGRDNDALDLSELKPGPVSKDDFALQTARLHKDSDLGFSDEYKNLKDMSPQNSWKAALIETNRSKNRWVNILPFDHSRVKLLPIDDEEGSDYINANYMPGYRSKREFIAAQGPLPGTKDDFWRMIWEQNVPIIVMLTNCVERGRPKCDQYWPSDREPVYYGDLQVQVTSESTLDSYTIRIMNVSLNGIYVQKCEQYWPDGGGLEAYGKIQVLVDQEENHEVCQVRTLWARLGDRCRTMKQMHFTRWPDFGCPANPGMLLDFVSSVRMHMPHGVPVGPILVHCSAGVGRTGTFVVVDRLMQHIQDHNAIDVFGIILEMRNYRCNMVQTEDQYIYIHDCLVTAITGVSPSRDDPSTDSEYDEKEDESTDEDEEDEEDAEDEKKEKEDSV